MPDILQDLSNVVAEIGDCEADSDTLDISTIYILLSRAVDEIERLRKANSDMGWELNPDRMGGQFTQEEINRSEEGW